MVRRATTHGEPNVQSESRSSLRTDVIAGLTTGIANMPDAMASAVLAGVSPITGLYALMAGTPVAALLTSSIFLNASATSAIAIAVGDSLSGTPAGEARDAALTTLTLLVGIILVAGGLLKAGRLLRFVSNAVMIGFLTGVSILIVLSQLGDFTGYGSEYDNKVIKAVDLLLHPSGIEPTVLATGLLTVAAILVADRTRARSFSMLIGIVVGSAAVELLGWTLVPTVADIATIPESLPFPSLPDTQGAAALIVDAAAIALIAMVQGAGVSRGYRNPDGHYADPSRDFVGVGAGNVAASLIGGLTIGGSVGSTALNVSAGARTRLANIVSGLVVVLAVLLLAGLVARLALPSMAGLLIVAGIGSIKLPAIIDVWEVGPFPRSVMIATVILTLTLPVQQAVLVGALLSAIATVVQASADVRVVELVAGPGDRWTEGPGPATLPSRAVTVVQMLGSLSFAAADRIIELLPSPVGSERPVVVIRLRQHVRLNSTLLVVLQRYIERVERAHGRVLLAGVNQEVAAQLLAADSLLPGLSADDIFPASPELGLSTEAAIAVGRAWIDAQDGVPPTAS
jgi:SulP family sulfate permease